MEPSPVALTAGSEIGFGLTCEGQTWVAAGTLIERAYLRASCA